MKGKAVLYIHADDETEVDELRRLRVELLSKLVLNRPIGRLILRL